MSSILSIVFPVFFVIALGWGFRQLRVLSPQDGQVLSRVAFYVALPTLLFHSLATADLGGSDSLAALGGVLIGYIIVAVLCIAIALAARKEKPVVSALTLTAANGNHAYIGLPVIGFAYGSSGLAVAACLTGLLGIWVALSAVIVGVFFSPDQSRKKGWAVLRDGVARLVRNPLMISVCAGLALNLLGVQFPLFIDRGLTLIAQSSASIGLLAIGLNLNFAKLGKGLVWIFISVIMRLFVTSAIVWGIYQLLPVSELAAKVGTLLLATPVGVTTYVTVSEAGGDTDLASGALLLSTLLSPLTMALVLYLLS